MFVDLVQSAPSITKPFPCRRWAKTYLLITLQKKMMGAIFKHLFC